MAPRTPEPGRVIAVLGPTNTGKTHLAVERLLGHASGVFGLPLRLLAREVYDRVVATKGRSATALITGEEKIVPPRAAYFVCTTESMPVGRPVEFVAVDEVQLAADVDRGHVFTDRLLQARGRSETMFLGADPIRPLLRRMVPEAVVETRPRFSRLTFAGHRKLSRMPRRSAVVSFSAEDVYSVAELVRRYRGGAAVVLGALSPRTRNAQVAMFENGDVDYLIATDAIGMGLNLNVNHVAFAALRKFDGFAPRPLTPAEVAQIAGRAGRYMTDGTFGTTGQCLEADPHTVERVEDHRFEAVRRVRWRNSALDFSSARALLQSLDARPPEEWRRFMTRPRRAVDRDAFAALSANLHVRGAERVQLLWDICQIPDYRKTLTESHTRLLTNIFGFLSANKETVPTEWLADRVARLDRRDGDIDTLAARIAQIRTWTYVCHRHGWVRDPEHWQGRTREVEDRLSDALHDRLTQRFVDPRSTAVNRSLGRREEVVPLVDADGSVRVDGHAIGRLEGLRFLADHSDDDVERRLLRTAAQRALRSELRDRSRRILREPAASFGFNADGDVSWRGAAVARLARGTTVAQPRLVLLAEDLLDGLARRQLEARLGEWLSHHLAEVLAPLRELQSPGLTPPARGLAFQVAEGLGTVRRASVLEQILALRPGDRKELGRRGLRLGALAIFLPTMHQESRPALAARLCALHRGVGNLGALPVAPAIPADPTVPDEMYLASGRIVVEDLALRVHFAERIAADLCRRRRAADSRGRTPRRPDADRHAEAYAAVAAALLSNGGVAGVRAPRAAQRVRKRKPPSVPARPPGRHSPFAVLAEHLPKDGAGA